MPTSNSAGNRIHVLLWLCTVCSLIKLVKAQESTTNNNECPQSYSLTIPPAAVKKHTNRDKLVIAHRGASFHLPEHTLAAYRLALEMGADFVEPDLVATADGHLIAMHTADLNVTTNVDEVFGNDATRSPWFSPFVNRSGWWSYNFTLEEIKTLRVKQRLPRARTTVYDGLFDIPTLTEIQQLVNTWNNERIPQLLLHVDTDEEDSTAAVHVPVDNSTSALNNNSSLPVHEHYRQSAGIYAELKASPWFQNDANISLVDLFLQTLRENKDHVFDSIRECPDLFKFDEYKVPPLVVQSFEGHVLQELTEKWNDKDNDNSLRQSPTPPMILLLGKKDCWEETVWFEIGETWRRFIQGLGMDKACFPKIGNDVEEGKGVKGRAGEFNLVIHPYTERPEHEFLMDGFQDAFEEMQYLMCTVGAQGVFTESVHTALLAARMGCPGTNNLEEGGATTATTTTEKEASPQIASNLDESTTLATGTSASSGTPSVKPSLCWEDTSEANLYLGAASFVLGIFVTAMLAFWINRGFSCSPQRPPREQQIPQVDGDDNNSQQSIEEPPDDELL